MAGLLAFVDRHRLLGEVERGLLKGQDRAIQPLLVGVLLGLVLAAEILRGEGDDEDQGDDHDTENDQLFDVHGATRDEEKDKEGEGCPRGAAGAPPGAATVLHCNAEGGGVKAAAPDCRAAKMGRTGDSAAKASALRSRAQLPPGVIWLYVGRMVLVRTPGTVMSPVETSEGRRDEANGGLLPD